MHWRRITPGRDNTQEVVSARLKLTEEVMGKEASKKLEVKGLMFPQWQAAQYPAAPVLNEYAT